MTDTLISTTQSVCPECLRSIPASFCQKQDGNVYMEKDCPEHGHFSCVVWRGTPSMQTWGKPVEPAHPQNPFTKVDKGCPFDCGLCPEHNQEACCVLFEVTQRCDLGCPTCFASAGRGTSIQDPSLETIRFWYEQLKKSGGQNFIQITGGEPTMRDDLPEIIKMGKDLNFPFFQLNSNGIRIAREEGFIEKLRDAGLDTVFLQFDGTNDEIYQKIRGKDLFEIKKQAIERCKKANIGVVLVPTIIPGVNDSNLGEIVRFALANMPVVRSVHIQPVCYMGRYDAAPLDSDRITLPEIFQNIEDQTKGLIKADNFKSGGGQHPICAFQAIFVQMEDGSLEALTHFTPNNTSCCCSSDEPSICGCGVGKTNEDKLKASDILDKAQNFVSRTWRYPRPSATVSLKRSISFSAWDNFIERKRTHQFTISGMAFQDAWNLDLDRLKLCYIMIMSTDGKLIPFCAYNLTSRQGKALYRNSGDTHK